MEHRACLQLRRPVAVWVEGQVAQLSRRPGAGLAFVTLRDTEADMSVTVTALPRVLERIGEAGLPVDVAR